MKRIEFWVLTISAAALYLVCLALDTACDGLLELANTVLDFAEREVNG